MFNLYIQIEPGVPPLDACNIVPNLDFFLVMLLMERLGTGLLGVNEKI